MRRPAGIGHTDTHTADVTSGGITRKTQTVKEARSSHGVSIYPLRGGKASPCPCSLTLERQCPVTFRLPGTVWILRQPLSVDYRPSKKSLPATTTLPEIKADGRPLASGLHHPSARIMCA